MVAVSPTSPGLPSSPDQPGTGIAMPPYIAILLHTTRILLGYGRHLLGTIRQRAAAPTFTTFGASFGTANLSTILAHLNRGILRAAALERILLARAATGRDITLATPRAEQETPPAPAAAQPDPPARPARNPRLRPSRQAGADDPELLMPTPSEIERQVLRRTIGRTITDICLDLAIVPDFCTGPFWTQLYQLLGDGFVTLMRETTRRQNAFIQAQSRTIGSHWNWLGLKRDEIRAILGFFIGEPPVNPFAADATLATGPP